MQKVGISEIPRSIAAKLTNKTYPLVGSGGNYIVELDVFHQLHCLVSLTLDCLSLQWLISCDAEHVEDGLDSLLGAWKQSLAIYFYRRIYDVDASLLQQKVAKVLQCISRYEAVDSGRTSCASARLIWPAFIAASEAEGLGLQQSFADWFNSSMRVSGLQIFRDTLRTIEQSWQDRTSLAGLSHTSDPI